MSLLKRAAAERGQTMTLTEGSRHTKVSIGHRRTVVPRHHEINELTAKAILKQMGVEP